MRKLFYILIYFFLVNIISSSYDYWFIDRFGDIESSIIDFSVPTTNEIIEFDHNPFSFDVFQNENSIRVVEDYSFVSGSERYSWDKPVFEFSQTINNDTRESIVEVFSENGFLLFEEIVTYHGNGRISHEITKNGPISRSTSFANTKVVFLIEYTPEGEHYNTIGSIRVQRNVEDQFVTTESYSFRGISDESLKPIQREWIHNLFAEENVSYEETFNESFIFDDTGNIVLNLIDSEEGVFSTEYTYNGEQLVLIEYKFDNEIYKRWLFESGLWFQEQVDIDGISIGTNQIPYYFERINPQTLVEERRNQFLTENDIAIYLRNHKLIIDVNHKYRKVSLEKIIFFNPLPYSPIIANLSTFYYSYEKENLLLSEESPIMIWVNEEYDEWLELRENY